jgi:hypothetical protein
MPINPYSESERLEAMFAASYAAVAEHFSHLPVRHIISPPRDLYDAMLARQIAIHIVNVQFRVPRRRIATCLKRQRSSILFGNRKVSTRCRREPLFAAAYRRMASRAKLHFFREMKAAA